jgi:hypothetical protein
MKYVFGFAFLLNTVFIHAQNSPTVFTRNMFWPGILGEYKFNDSWSAILDAQFRYEYTDSDIFQWYVRPSVTRKLNNGLLLSVGVGYFQLYPNPNGALPARPEWRPWQEVGYRFKPNFHHMLYPRARLEQRFIREYAGTDLADELTFNSYRLRLRFDYTYAIGKETAGPWFLIAGNELFLYQKTDGFSAFDQNRTWAGVGFKINANHNIQLSYLYLYQQRNSAVADQFHTCRIIYQFTLARTPKEAPQQ